MYTQNEEGPVFCLDGCGPAKSTLFIVTFWVGKKFFFASQQKMSARPTQKQQRPQNQARRYRAGQVPENYIDDLSDSEEEEEQVEEPVRRKRGEVQFAQKEVDTGVKQTTISEKDASTDRRLRRLQQAHQAQHLDDDSGRRRRRQVESDDEQEDEDEDEKARERMLLKQKALQQQEEEQVDSEQEGSEEGSEEEEVSITVRIAV